jgi:hypothetical protein
MPKDSDDEKEPNSVGYWRHNTIMALKGNRQNERDAVDPEHLAAINANNAELAKLEAQAAAVKARHASIVAKRRQRERGEDREL